MWYVTVKSSHIIQVMFRFVEIQIEYMRRRDSLGHNLHSVNYKSLQIKSYPPHNQTHSIDVPFRQFISMPIYLIPCHCFAYL